MSYAIDVRNLSKTFHPRRGLARWLSASPIAHDLTVLDGLNLQVQRGEIFGLLGPNGAGKSTLLRILATLIHPTSGEARVLGHHTVREEARVRERVGLVLGDERSFYWRLTGRENLQFFGALYGLSGRVGAQRIEEVAALLFMGDYLDQRYDVYSTGMRQKLSLARGLLGGAAVLLLDEPTRGLDPAASGHLLSAIRTLSRDGGVTIVMVTHRVSEAQAVCDRVGILSKGCLKLVSDPGAIADAAGSARCHTFHGGDDVASAVPSGVRTLSLTVEEPVHNLNQVLDVLRREGLRIVRVESGQAPGQALVGPDGRREVG